jgi:hypothetical protein
MPTMHEYFETDFAHVLRLRGHFELGGQIIEARMMCDLAAFVSFVSVYVDGKEHDLHFFLQLLQNIQHGKTTFHFDHEILMPDAWDFPGALQIDNKPERLQN